MKLETVKVKNQSGDGFIIINKSDLDGSGYVLWDEACGTDFKQDYPEAIIEKETIIPDTTKRGRPFKSKRS